MKSRNLLVAACMLGLAWELPVTYGQTAPAAPAGVASPATAPAPLGLDAAKKAFADKRYDDVDPALAELLGRKIPDTDAERLSLESALASGHMVTANQRANDLLKLTAGHDLDILFTSAAAADAVGDSRLALVRYLAFARQNDAKSDRLATALEYILGREAYPEEYKKSVKLYGVDDDAWRTGQHQLARLIDEADADRTLDLADYLLQTFPEPQHVSKVHEMIFNAAEASVFGKSGKEKYLKPLEMLARHPSEEPRFIDQLFSRCQGAMDEESRVRLTLALMSTLKTPLPGSVLGQFAVDMRALKNADLKAQAAAAYVATAPLYASADWSPHYSFLRILGETPEIYHAKQNPLVSSEAMRKMVEAWLAKHPTAIGSARELIGWTEQQYLSGDPPARIDFLQQHLAMLSPQELAELASLQPSADPAGLLNQWSPGKSFREVLEARIQLVGQFTRVKDKASLLSVAKDYLAAYPATFNPDQLNQALFGNSLISNEEKIAVVKEAIEQAGYSTPMKGVIDSMNGNAAWAKDPAFVQLKASFDARPVGKDPLAAALVALTAIKTDEANPSPAVTEIMAKCLAADATKLPGGNDKLATVRDILIQDLFQKHESHVRRNVAAANAWAEAWCPRMLPSSGSNSNWELVTTRLKNTGQGALLARLTPMYIAAVRGNGGAAAGSKNVWVNLSRSKIDANGTSPVSAAYDLMGPDLPVSCIVDMRGAWDANRQGFVDELGRALAATGGKAGDPVASRELLNHLYGLVNGGGNGPVKIPAATIESLWDSYRAAVEKGDIPADLDVEARTHDLFGQMHLHAEADAFLTAYLKWIETRPPQLRIDSLFQLFHWSHLAGDKPAWAMNPNSGRTILFKNVKPLYEQLTPRDYDRQTIAGNALQELYSALAAGIPAEPKPDAAVLAAIADQKKQAHDLAALWMTMMDHGAKMDAPPSYMFGICQSFCKEAMAAKDPIAINLAFERYGYFLSLENLGDQNFNEQIAPFIKLLDDAGYDETTYIFVSAIQHGRIPDSVARQLLLAKARAATRIKGLIPVPATDPSYDLYLASASLMGGDESKAWELTGPKLKLLETGWEGFNARYVAWAIEQIRKQKMLKESLEFAFNVLLHENDLDADTAGKVLLTQADIYKDLENYQAARIGYEGLKGNNRYAKTDAGQKAVYRLVELHILTKDYTAAETLLERMVDADDVKKQAEAYYLCAEMAYQQGQYKEAKDYLKKVRDRVTNHVEAALLEGELNLILPGGLANTEVAIGDPRLSTVVIPGRYLTLDLQDPNLAVARGGASIPVIVTTSKGGDVEHVKLLPSSSNKNLFSTRIATALGHAQKDDLTLQLLGDDVVSYVIDPEFQKANDLHYPPKLLAVRDDARLVASSGEILSEEEEEKRELEKQMRQHESLESRRFDVVRDGHTIRPGSPIYLEVSDAAQDLSDAPDIVKVDLRTSSGEGLEGFTLTETGPHTGVFRGAAPTGIPGAKVAVSDADDSKDPSGVIHPGHGEGWVSLADGRKNKWIEVDTMGSHEVTSVTMEIPHLDTVKDVALLGMLADDYEELAAIPARADAVKGGVQIDVANDNGGNTVEQMRRRLKLVATETVSQPAPALIRNNTPMKDKGGDGTWATCHLHGVFYLPESRTLELQYLQPFEGFNLRSFVLIDGQPVLGEFTHQSAQITGRVDLIKGAHTLEILFTDNHVADKVILGYRQPDGTLAALPSDWFSVEQHPELVAYLKPKGSLSIKGDLLTATFDKPVRLRKVRALFRDFTGTAMAVKNISIADSAGKAVVPIPVDAAANGMLRIAPGDQVTVSYTDEKRLHGETKVLTQNLSSSFYNGTIALAEERITANPNDPNDHRTEFLEAKRCRAGDQLMVVVTDYDEDTTDQRDTVDVKVTTSSGESLTLKALETYVNHEGSWNSHAGQFLAVLKFGNQTKGDTIKVSPGDQVTVSYIDRENTDPGIPIERSYTVTEAGAEAPRVVVYRTNVKMVPDDSPEAKARLKRIAGRETKGATLYKPLTIATHPGYVSPTPTTQPARKDVVASVEAPLLFEVTYPRMALNAGSVLEVSAVADSELQAAAKEKREPAVLKVPTYVQSIDELARIKGYPIQLQSALRRGAIDMLKAGAFSGVIRLQVGSKGDPIDDLVSNGQFMSENQRLADAQGMYYKVPTLLVSGSDVVHIRVKDISSGQVIDTPVRLLSDARLDLLDPTYVIANESIHLGEKFHVRITDPDHDISNDRDTVAVKVKASSGAEATLTLSETMPHSGIFTATLEPQFMHAPPTTRPAATEPALAEPTIRVDFGDTLTFTYVDDLSLESTSPVTVSKTGKILLGSDAQVVAFSKRFKDPEIAVKTRFLMAEALFETAKEHRKINETKAAEEEISRGKMILDEAIRDYPNTSLAPQGEYLLANLAQELTNYQEAVGRYANVISTWPDSEYASESQFKQALCYEKMGKNDQAVEEYVKLTYLYPDSPLVADATIRLGNYYLKQNAFKTAGKIFSSFAARNPTHRLAPQSMFLAAQCAYKQADYKDSVDLFAKTADSYPDEKTLRPEAMYWLADSAFKVGDNVKAFRTFKKVTWDYPESEWAKAARGRLTEDVFSRMQEQEQ